MKPNHVSTLTKGCRAGLGNFKSLEEKKITVFSFKSCYTLFEIFLPALHWPHSISEPLCTSGLTAKLEPGELSTLQSPHSALRSMKKKPTADIKNSCAAQRPGRPQEDVLACLVPWRQEPSFHQETITLRSGEMMEGYLRDNFKSRDLEASAFYSDYGKI